ncbi:MAG: hypothetical protein ABI068_16780 [Ktedonobacterales bacterium]
MNTDAVATFRASRSLDELAHEQHISPVTGVHALVLPAWQDESIDDVLLFIKGQREAAQS